MKISMLVIALILFLQPLTVSADPENQTADPMTEYVQNISEENQKDDESTSNSQDSRNNENPSSSVQEYVDEFESEKSKKENLEDTKEAIAEDIVLY